LAKNSSFIFFKHWLFALAEKINVLFVRLVFLVQMLMFNTIFCIMHNGLGYDFVVESSAGLFRRNPAV
jgi:hypothetical protein